MSTTAVIANTTTKHIAMKEEEKMESNDVVGREMNKKNAEHCNLNGSCSDEKGEGADSELCVISIASSVEKLHIAMKEEEKMESNDVVGREMNKKNAEHCNLNGSCSDEKGEEGAYSELCVITTASSLDKQQLDKEKNDEVSRKYMQEGPAKTIDSSTATKVESKEIVAVAVQVLNLVVQSPDRADEVIPIPFPPSTSKSTLFTLKESSKYRIIFNFVVSGKKTVSGLKYVGDVWKKGIKVDHSKKLIGTFCPRTEAYVFEVENATTPSGFFARGSYSARAKFVDGDGKTYLDTIYYFDIARTWASFSK